MNFVRRDTYNLRFTEKAFIYKPIPRTIEGEVDGKEYKIIVKEPELPPGTTSGPPSNLSLISWDESFYLTWDIPEGFFQHYKLEVRDPSDNIVFEALSLDPDIEFYSLTKEENADNNLLVNGTQYTLKFGATLLDVTDYAPEVSFTPTDKTPTNVSKESQSSSEVVVSWSTVAGDVSGYEVVLEDSITSSEVSRKFVNSSPGAISIPNPGLYDIYIQSVNTTASFKSDKSSVIQVYISEEISDLSAVFTSNTDEVNLTWTGTSLADSYNVYYRFQGDSFSLLENTMSTDRVYDAFDFGNGTWEFKVVPVKSSLNGRDSNISSTEIDIPVMIISNSDMVEKTDNQVFDGSDVEFVVTESDMNESVTTS